MLALVLRGDDCYLQLHHRYVYNAAIEGSSIMVRVLFEFIGVVTPGGKTIPTKLQSSKTPGRSGDTFTLATLPVTAGCPPLSSATPSHFATHDEEQFLARLLWGINKRTSHPTLTEKNGAEPSDIKRAAKIILRELRARFYGYKTPIEINEHLANDINRKWEGFDFAPPPQKQ
jgi:hypothetical protein